MKKQQPTYLGLRPLFIKHFLRGSTKCLPYLGNLLDEIIFGVLDEESAKAESAKIHDKLNEIIKGQDQQEGDFAEILLALHIQTDINETIKQKLEQIEQSLRNETDAPFPDYFEKALDQVIQGHEEIRDDLQRIFEQQTLEHDHIKEKLDKIVSVIDINPKIKAAVENVFLFILKEKEVPEYQWPEKLEEIARRHQELLDQWQTIQSDDPEVDDLRESARQFIEQGDYDSADKTLQDAVELDREAIRTQQAKLDKRKLSIVKSLARRAELAETKLNYQKAIDLYQEALNLLPQNQLIEEASLKSNAPPWISLA